MILEDIDVLLLSIDIILSLMFAIYVYFNSKLLQLLALRINIARQRQNDTDEHILGIIDVLLKKDRKSGDKDANDEPK
jgi:hypothetical protein